LFLVTSVYVFVPLYLYHSICDLMRVVTLHRL
jgi:hypothetical protein